MPTTRDLQARLHALGYNPGVIDGLWGSNTAAAQQKAIANGVKIWHNHGLHRIHLHWTAGAYGVIPLELEHYHVIIGGPNGKVYYGRHKPEANADCSDGRYAAHTRAANTGAIGVAIDAMGGAKERPFNAGTYPITSNQLYSMAKEVASLCQTYDIPVTKYSVLTHAEVGPTLGIPQRGKWDITWIPPMSKPGNPIEVGNILRNMIREAM